MTTYSYFLCCLTGGTYGAQSAGFFLGAIFGAKVGAVAGLFPGSTFGRETRAYCDAGQMTHGFALDSYERTSKVVSTKIDEVSFIVDAKTDELRAS